MSLDHSTFTITDEPDDVICIAVTSLMNNGLADITDHDVVRISRESVGLLIDAITYCLDEGYRRDIDTPGADFIFVYLTGPDHLPYVNIVTKRLRSTGINGGAASLTNEAARELVAVLSKVDR